MPTFLVERIVSAVRDNVVCATVGTKRRGMADAAMQSSEQFKSFKLASQPIPSRAQSIRRVHVVAVAQSNPTTPSTQRHHKLQDAWHILFVRGAPRKPPLLRVLEPSPSSSLSSSNAHVTTFNRQQQPPRPPSTLRLHGAQQGPTMAMSPLPRQLHQSTAITLLLFPLLLSFTTIKATARVLPRSHGISSRHHPPSAFTFLGLPIPALPDIQMPSSPIEVKLVYQRVIDPIHYGDYCGPTPEITPSTGCQHPLNLEALDDTDEVCRLHDHFYCKCDSVYARQGKTAPSSALIATRSVQSGFRKTYLANLDHDYYLCVHEADQEMLGNFDTLVSEGRLPAKYWDPVTRWKFDSLLDVFRRNMVVDAEILDLQAQGGMERGRAYWFGEDEKRGEGATEQASNSHESATITGKGKGLESSSQVVTATTSSNGKL